MACLICEVWNSVKFPFGNCKWLSRFSLCFKFKFCHLWVLHAERLTWLDTSVSGFCPTLFGLENIYNIRNIWNFLANIRYWDIVIKQSWYSWRHLRWRITLREREESALACLTGGGLWLQVPDVHLCQTIKIFSPPVQQQGAAVLHSLDTAVGKYVLEQSFTLQ